MDGLAAVAGAGTPFDVFAGGAQQIDAQPDIKLLINNSTNESEVMMVQASLQEAYMLMTTGQRDQGMEIVNQLLLASRISF